MTFEKPKKQIMPMLRLEELPKLMRSLVMSNLSVPTRYLIEQQLLTSVRPSEASGARWAEDRSRCKDLDDSSQTDEG